MAVNNSFTVAIGRLQSWRALPQPGKSTHFTVCTISLTLLMSGDYIYKWTGASGALYGMGSSLVHLHGDLIILVFE